MKIKTLFFAFSILISSTILAQYKSIFEKDTTIWKVCKDQPDASGTLHIILE